MVLRPTEFRDLFGSIRTRGAVGEIFDVSSHPTVSYQLFGASLDVTSFRSSEHRRSDRRKVIPEFPSKILRHAGCPCYLIG